MSVLGDLITNIPVNNDAKAKAEELSFLSSIFQTKGTVTVNNTFGQIKQALIITVLFVILRVPYIYNIIFSITNKNTLYANIAIAGLFFLAYVLLEKFLFPKL